MANRQGDVILCWQERDFEEVAVPGADDAWRVAAEVIWYGATFIISIIFIRDISTMDINNNNNNNNHKPTPHSNASIYQEIWETTSSYPNLLAIRNSFI